MEKLITKFNKVIKSSLKSDLKKKNIFEVPRLEKVVVSSGVGDYKDDDGAIKKIADDLAKITGLKAKINHSRKAVSSFKLRIGQPVGLTVTLRGEKMFDFLDRLVNIALPRVRDFRGVSKKAFDGHGNYSMGIKEHAIFPEIKYEDIGKPFGFQVNIKTTAKNDDDTKALLMALGFPFEKKQNAQKVEAPVLSPEEVQEKDVTESAEGGAGASASEGMRGENQESNTEEQILNTEKEQNG